MWRWFSSWPWRPGGCLKTRKPRKRISIIHKKMEMGKTWVFKAHKEQGLIAVNCSYWVCWLGNPRAGPWRVLKSWLKSIGLREEIEFQFQDPFTLSRWSRTICFHSWTDIYSFGSAPVLSSDFSENICGLLFTSVLSSVCVCVMSPLWGHLNYF